MVLRAVCLDAYIKEISCISVPFRDSMGSIHGMAIDLDKYIYPNYLNKLTTYVYVALLLRNKKEYILIKNGASFNFIILMV